MVPFCMHRDGLMQDVTDTEKGHQIRVTKSFFVTFGRLMKALLWVIDALEAAANKPWTRTR